MKKPAIEDHAYGTFAEDVLFFDLMQYMIIEERGADGEVDMMTVTILINGQPIMARSAVNKGEANNRRTRYQVDDGSVIFHKPEDGAVALAIKLLKTIKEQGR